MKLIELTDGSGVTFLLNADIIQTVGPAHDDSGTPILGRYIVRTSALVPTPQGVQQQAYLVRENLNQVKARVNGGDPAK